MLELTPMLLTWEAFVKKKKKKEFSKRITFTVFRRILAIVHQERKMRTLTKVPGALLVAQQ